VIGWSQILEADHPGSPPCYLGVVCSLHATTLILLGLHVKSFEPPRPSIMHRCN
jgi:hypothetical protein